MARSMLDRLMGNNKNEAKYEPYDFKKKYGPNKVINVDKLLNEFDEKLVLVLREMRKKGNESQKELIALYEERAKQFPNALASLLFDDPIIYYYRCQMLARSIQMFDDFIEGNDPSKNNEQCLLLARDMDERVDFAFDLGIFVGFLAVTFIVTAIVVAVTVEPVLIIPLLAFTLSPLVLAVDDIATGIDSAKGKEALTSFTEAGKGFFSDAAEDKPSPDEPKQEKEVEKASWYWPFGGGGEK